MSQTNTEKLWGEVLSEIELLVSRANFVTWFQKTSIKENISGVVFINVPNSFTKEWLRNKYEKFIIKILRNIEPSIRAVEYVICNQPAFDYKMTKKQKILEANKETSQLELKDFYSVKSSLNPRYVFENFVVGSFNELAHAAAMAVVKNPGATYNPLFIYGGVGLGKTHLLQATGNKISENFPELKTKYTTTEKFANELVLSIQNNTTYAFKENYKKYDLLIIDDVQFVAGKNKSQEELFHIFNTLYENGKQIIFSSDRAPKAIPDLEERLRSRFEGGMMADISEPEFEARVAILKTKTKEKNLDISNEAMEHIASVLKTNIREIEGALNMLSAQTKLLGKSLSIQETKDLFNKNILYSKKKITFNKIIKTVADFYEVEEQYLFEKTRKKEFVLPRQIAMFLLREDFNGSYPYIGQKFGGRDHTTVIHAYEKVSNGLKKDQRLKNDIQKIRDFLYV